MELNSLSIAELQKLKTTVEKEIGVRMKSQRNKALDEIKSIAAKYGLNLVEVVGGSPQKSKPRKTAIKTAAKCSAKAKNILYRHPENSQLTWGGGRGRRPQWIKDWETAGRSLDEARVS